MTIATRITKLIDVCRLYRDKMEEYRRIAERDPFKGEELFAEAQLIQKAFEQGAEFAERGGRL